jgi:hypothetical protein
MADHRTGIGEDGEWGLLETKVIAHGQRKATQAIAAHLSYRAVGIEDTHGRNPATITGEYQNSIGTNPVVAVAERHCLLRRELATGQLPAVQQDEVIARTLDFQKWQGGHDGTPPRWHQQKRTMAIELKLIWSVKVWRKRGRSSSSGTCARSCPVRFPRTP